MSQQPHPLFVLDANVIMAAHRDYYAPDFCPGFWDCILHYFQARRLISIDRVFGEIKNPGDLVQWAQNVPNGLFAFSGEPLVRSNFTSMMTWVQGSAQFLPSAKSEFASVADGWLAAYAKAHNAFVVTQEVLAPDAKKRVPLPNLCRQFNVPYLNTFEMLRQLGVRFDLSCTP